MLGAMGLEGDKKAKETLDPEQARSAHIQSISQHVSNVPRVRALAIADWRETNVFRAP
jgi:hypothetical protein